MNKKWLARVYTDSQVTIFCKNHFQKGNENKMIFSVETDHLDFIYMANEKEIIHFKMIYIWKWKWNQLWNGQNKVPSISKWKQNEFEMKNCK